VRVKRKTSLHDIDPVRTRLFRPELSDKERSAELTRLADRLLAGKLDSVERGTVAGALWEFSTYLSYRHRGKPKKPLSAHRRIALARAWLLEHFDDLRATQRAEILCAVLAIKPRALTTVPQSEAARAPAHVRRWAATPTGAQTILQLGAAGEEKRRYNARARMVRANSRR
jgi:hypothetical protein